MKFFKSFINHNVRDVIFQIISHPEWRSTFTHQLPQDEAEGRQTPLRALIQKYPGMADFSLDFI